MIFSLNCVNYPNSLRNKVKKKKKLLISFIASFVKKKILLLHFFLVNECWSWYRFFS